ncbi:MAG: 50S ribosomal protein L16 [Candidatus Yanofskybacteria bacterium]|nr:50S ribosomal protein L16 [Candidatus Yanofskybacteria bacterium]
MLQPARVKHTKVHKGRLKAAATRGVHLSFGNYGLKAEESSWVRANQLESARRALAQLMQRGGKIWVRVFPDKPRTAKSSEVGMGGGRGALSHFVVPVEAGRILFEIDGLSAQESVKALQSAAHKLPIKTKIVKRNS